MKKKEVLLDKNYDGFEDILDGIRDIEDSIELLPGEYQGTVRILVEYFPEDGNEEV